VLQVTGRGSKDETTRLTPVQGVIGVFCLFVLKAFCHDSSVSQRGAHRSSERCAAA
jgi:hypothetical protein